MAVFLLQLHFDLNDTLTLNTLSKMKKFERSAALYFHTCLTVVNFGRKAAFLLISYTTSTQSSMSLATSDGRSAIMNSRDCAKSVSLGNAFRCNSD